MNKYQEALSNYFKAKQNFDNEMYKSMELLEELVDRATPIKPEGFGGFGYDKCPVCNARVTNNYCSHCGQKLDWSDEK